METKNFEQQVAEMQNAFACAQRVFDLIEEEPQKAENPFNLEKVSGDIVIKNASFCYDP